MTRIALDALAGASLNVEQTGSGSPLLATHGFPGSASTWDEFAAEARGEQSVIAVDMLGHGASDAPNSPALYDMEHTVRALAEVLDRLGIAAAHWLGYSMGGRIALAAAISLPQRTLSLTLESGSPGLATAEERVARVRDDEALADRIERQGLEAFVAYWEALPLWASQARLAPKRRQQLHERRLSNNPVGLANSLRGMGTGAQPSFHDRLAGLQAPALFIAGEEDSKFVSVAREMHRAAPGSRLCIVPEAGHAVHLEQPRRFNAAVLDFLRGLEAPGTPQGQTVSQHTP